MTYVWYPNFSWLSKKKSFYGNLHWKNSFPQVIMTPLVFLFSKWPSQSQFRIKDSNIFTSKIFPLPVGSLVLIWRLSPLSMRVDTVCHLGSVIRFHYTLIVFVNHIGNTGLLRLKHCNMDLLTSSLHLHSFSSYLYKPQPVFPRRAQGLCMPMTCRDVEVSVHQSSKKDRRTEETVRANQALG